jgi:xylulokinase
LASELGIDPSAVVSYRAGDQPNNAFSLQVLEPGEVAATAGTSGVVYGVTEQRAADKQSRVNTFVHVTNQTNAPRYGVLLCINGTGSLNRWLKDEWGGDYATMNDLAASSPVGSRGVSYLPYGNGAERTLMNRLLGAALLGLDLNTHKRADIFRSAQEGIAFAMRYGFEALKNSGVTPSTIRAGRANMFLSPIFQEAFTTALNVPLELFATDGAQGAARGAGIGAGIYRSVGDAFNSLKALEVIRPTNQLVAKYEEAYQRWVEGLQALLNRKVS